MVAQIKSDFMGRYLDHWAVKQALNHELQLIFWSSHYVYKSISNLLPNKWAVLGIYERQKSTQHLGNFEYEVFVNFILLSPVVIQVLYSQLYLFIHNESFFEKQIYLHSEIVFHLFLKIYCIFFPHAFE